MLKWKCLYTSHVLSHDHVPKLTSYMSHVLCHGHVQEKENKLSQKLYCVRNTPRHCAALGRASQRRSTQRDDGAKGTGQGKGGMRKGMGTVTTDVRGDEEVNK